MITLDSYKVIPLKDLPEDLRWDMASIDRRRGVGLIEVSYADSPTKTETAKKGSVYMRVWNHSNGVIEYFKLTPRTK